MIRTLLLLRHAKSDWGDPGVVDHDRPLNTRGRRTCRVLRDHFVVCGLEPALVVCSTSTRTRETLGRILPAWGGAQTLELVPGLYGADATEIMYVLHGVDAKVPSVLVVGHNPGLADLAVRLATRTRGEAAARMALKYPTGALAVFDVDTPWESLTPEDATLVDFFTPRESEGGAP